MNTYLIKTLSGFMPGDPPTKKWYDKIPVGGGAHGDFKQIRNIKFHRKFFALLNIGFDNWMPGEVSSKHGVPEKNFDRFREDLTILAGFYETHIRLDGSARITAKSISFAKMDEKEFSELYSKTIDVLIKYVYKNQDITSERINEIVETYLQFA